MFTLRERLMSLLASELAARIPQFRPQTSDYQMIIYAYRDLITWMRTKWELSNSEMVHRRLERYSDEHNRDLEVFFNFWLNQWLEKWRERVKILSKKIKIPQDQMEQIVRAERLYRQMKHKIELKRMIIRKLINQGEICMTEVIAKNLIIGEIAKCIQVYNKEPNLVTLDAFKILNRLSIRISKLPKEKGPLVYLNIGMYLI